MGVAFCEWRSIKTQPRLREEVFNLWFGSWWSHSILTKLMILKSGLITDLWISSFLKSNTFQGKTYVQVTSHITFQKRFKFPDAKRCKLQLFSQPRLQFIPENFWRLPHEWLGPWFGSQRQICHQIICNFPRYATHNKVVDECTVDNAFCLFCWLNVISSTTNCQ